MAKKSKSKRVKRVLGVKIPKPVGRFIASPGGRIALVGAVVAGGVLAARSPRVKAGAMIAAYEVKKAGRAAGMALGSAARAALTPVMAATQSDSAGKKAKKKAKAASPRLAQDDAEALSH